MNAKVKLEFWMGDRIGWSGPGPMIREENLEEGETVRSLLTRLAGEISQFRESVFDPQAQALSSEVTILINDRIPDASRTLEMKLKPGDRILFLPILAGG